MRGPAESAPSPVVRVALDEGEAAALRVAERPGALTGAIVTAAFLLLAAATIGAGFGPIAGLLLALPGLLIALVAVSVLGRPWIDASRREGLEVTGPWVVVRAEIEAAGRQPPKALWTLRSPSLKRPVSVPGALAVVVDPEGAQRVGARMAEGRWPGGLVPVAEVRDHGTFRVGRRSLVLVRLERTSGDAHPPNG